MPEPETIFAHVARLVEAPDALGRKHVVVTAGPTREAIDPVRFISNHSSGKMGVALAAAAWRRGAEVELVAGPMTAAAPAGVMVHHVESTEQMAVAVKRLLSASDVLIMAAAPADYRPAIVAGKKIKKSDAALALDLAPTPDILKTTIEARRPGSVVVGFALETNDAIASGKTKLASKALDMIVVNDATEPGAGFGVDTNRVTLLFSDGAEEHLPLMAKSEVADAILDRVETLLGR
jgi:phosphopantothenoylcysteine decarboxylase/phosphopantothenate--cysteine ligase